MEKAKCPKCGSTNLLWWQEDIITNYYKLNKYQWCDTFNDKPVRSEEDAGSGAHGYECKKCGCKWNSLSGYIINDGSLKG